MIYWAEFITFTTFSGIKYSSNVQLYSHTGFPWAPPKCYQNCGLGDMLQKSVWGWLSDISLSLSNAHLWCWELEEQTLISYWYLIVVVPYWLVVADFLGTLTVPQYLLYIWGSERAQCSRLNTVWPTWHSLAGCTKASCYWDPLPGEKTC